MRADRLLMDDRAGRKVAAEHGLFTAGTLAVLLDATISNLLNLDQALDRLAKTNFFATETLLNAIRAELARRSRTAWIEYSLCGFAHAV